MSRGNEENRRWGLPWAGAGRAEGAACALGFSRDSELLPPHNPLPLTQPFPHQSLRGINLSPLATCPYLLPLPLTAPASSPILTHFPMQIPLRGGPPVLCSPPLGL